MSPEIETLRAFLTSLSPGKVCPKTLDEIKRLLKNCWNELSDSNVTAMAAYKLERIEDITWSPPRLEFVVERHGAAAKGSVYAEMQPWSVNLETGQARAGPYGRRRLVGQLNPRLDVAPLAQQILRLVLTNTTHVWLKWNGPDDVKILVGKIVPSESIPQQTLRGRRKRLRQAIDSVLTEAGWQKTGIHSYRKHTETPRGSVRDPAKRSTN